MKDGTFTADRLLALYDRVAEAEDAIPRLRRFVLDLAVRGKLVEQDPSDEPAAELLKRIAKEKARLGIKRPSEGYEATDLPFALPRGWALSSIGEVCSKTGSGSTPRGGKEVYSDNGIPFLRSQNVYDDGLRLDDVALIAPEIHERMSGTAVKSADLLLNITGGSMGRCCRIPDEFEEANVSQHVAIIRAAVTGMADFLHRLVLSPYFQAFIFGEQTGAGRGGLPKNRMDRIAVALPPLAEQQRIVAKVDELMALCDRLQAARAGREAVRDRLTAATLARLTAPETDAHTFPTHARFALQTLPTLTTRPDQIKTIRQTILNLAVRGKLVAQDPTDEPAAELLKRIRVERSVVRKRNAAFEEVTEDEQTFPAPKGWSWQRFGEVFSIRTGFAFQSPTYSDSGVLVLRVVNFDRSGAFDFSDAKYFPPEKIDAKISQFLLREGEILMVMVGGTIGKTTVVSGAILPALLNQNMWRIRSYGELMNGSFEHMLIRFLNQNIENLTNSTHGHFAMSDFEQKAICIPPLAEQHRIVAKVDALMALCDQLEASLTTATTTRSRLLEALLHEALGGQSEAA